MAFRQEFEQFRHGFARAGTQLSGGCGARLRQVSVRTCERTDQRFEFELEPENILSASRKGKQAYSSSSSSGRGQWWRGVHTDWQRDIAANVTSRVINPSYAITRRTLGVEQQTERETHCRRAWIPTLSATGPRLPSPSVLLINSSVRPSSWPRLARFTLPVPVLSPTYLPGFRLSSSKCSFPRGSLASKS